MDVDAIERRLAAAREEEQAVYRGMGPANGGRTWGEFWAASDVVLQLERDLAAARGEEHAVPIEFPVLWDIGAPAPHLLQSDRKTFLMFCINEQDTHWDGTSVRIVDAGDETIEALALVQFLGVTATRFGDPNDEVAHGHPLHGRGLDAYRAQRVVNSRWLAELEAINRVHSLYKPESWRDRNHYVFWFHDSTFECIAQSFTVEVFRESFVEILARACRRLIE